jgi:hypothetical protein
MQYKKTQTGWVMIAVFSVILLSMTSRYVSVPQTNLPVGVFIVLVAVLTGVLLNFYQLTIVVDAQQITLIYGIGLIRIRLYPKEILQVKRIKIPWYHGFGIRVVSKGMLYNISGFNGVELQYVAQKPGQAPKQKTVWLGSNDGYTLQEAIKRLNPG